jgi:hypothetical protein
VQNDDIGPKTACVLKALEVGCDGAIFSMMVLGMYITLTNGELPAAPYLTTVAFGFLLSFSYSIFRKIRSQRKAK